MVRKLRNHWVTSASGLSSLLALLAASFILVAECSTDEPAKDTPTPTSGQSESFSSEAELAELIGQLKEPPSRMQALAVLVRFSSARLYQVGGLIATSGDRRLDEMQDRAAAAARSCADVETVGHALDSGDGELQFWGVWFWRTGFREGLSGEKSAWLSLLPKVEC